VDGRIIAIGLVMTAGLVYTRVFENEFFKDIILISIPTVIGLFVSKYAPSQWQKYRQKISMKRELINLFSESTTSLRSYQISLVRDISDSLSYHLSTTDKLIEKGIVQSDMIFPENPVDELQNKFHSQFLELIHKATEASIKRNLFKINLKLYTDDPKINSALNDLTQNNSLQRMYIKNLIYSQNIEEFIKISNGIRELSEEFTKKSDDFSTILVNMKIKKINV